MTEQPTAAAVEPPAPQQDNQPAPKTIWQELDEWAKSFQPWQKLVLATTVRAGQLTGAQVGQAYSQFLHDNDLADAPNPPMEIPDTITGRPATAALAPMYLARVGDLRAVNALPDNAALIFSPSLTVIYGRNGAGKSGFARVLSHGCFSRGQHKILPNI